MSDYDSDQEKQELIDQIIRLKAHNKQVKNVIKKHETSGEISKVQKPHKPFDFSKCSYRRVLLRILYFGWDYQGLATQKDSDQTIEHHLFHALTKSCLIESREKSKYHSCSRTDKGASASSLVISITLRSKCPENQDLSEPSKELPYCKMLNALLPKDIRVVAWMPIPADKPDFSARFNCQKRQYKYYFPRCALDLQAMREACKNLELEGRNDFMHLCEMDVKNGVTDFERELLKAEILPVNEKDVDQPTSMYYLRLEAKSFLWHQIRYIMAVLLLVGQKKEEPNVVHELFDTCQHQRRPQYTMALDLPGTLVDCTYDLNGKWMYDQQNLKMVLKQLKEIWTIKNIQSVILKDAIKELQSHYSSCASKTEDSTDTKSDRETVFLYSTCLSKDLKHKVHKPLMRRPTGYSVYYRMQLLEEKKAIKEGTKTEEAKE